MKCLRQWKVFHVALQDGVDIQSIKTQTTGTPVKTPTKLTARMKFGGDSKLLLKAVKRGLQDGDISSLKPVQGLNEVTVNSAARKSSELLLKHNCRQVLPIGQKLAQGSKSSSLIRKEKGALKEDNKAVSVVKRKLQKKTKTIAKTEKPTKKRDGAAKNKTVPNQQRNAPLADQVEVGKNVSINACLFSSSDSDNENIPLSRLKQIQKSKIGKGATTHKSNESPTAKTADAFTQPEDIKVGKKKLEKSSQRGMKAVVQVVDISPLIDKDSVTQNKDVVETASLASESTKSREADLNELEHQTQCDDYELVEMMERSEVIDCCPPGTDTRDKVQLLNLRGQHVIVPTDHPYFRPPELPPLEDLDIPDVILAELRKTSADSYAKCHQRTRPLELQYGHQWLKVPEGGPRFTKATLRQLSRMKHTGSNYWRQIHTPQAKFKREKEILFPAEPASPLKRKPLVPTPNQPVLPRKLKVCCSSRHVWNTFSDLSRIFEVAGVKSYRTEGGHWHLHWSCCPGQWLKTAVMMWQLWAVSDVPFAIGCKCAVLF